jgi:hypothetical protein
MSDNSDRAGEEAVKILLRGGSEGVSKALDRFGEGGMDEALGELRRSGSLISKFPEVESFLQSRGCTDISQLDKRGREELTAHLKIVHEAMTTRDTH